MEETKFVVKGLPCCVCSQVTYYLSYVIEKVSGVKVHRKNYVSYSASAGYGPKNMAVISAVALERIIINKTDISEVFLFSLQVFQTVFRFKMKSS